MSASRLPRLSALMMTPSVVCSIRMDCISLVIFSLMIWVVSGVATMSGVPGIALSRPVALMRTPLAAWTSLTLLNFDLRSRISASGSGSKRPLTLETSGPSSLPNMMVSPVLRVPS